MTKQLRRRQRGERGASAVEYALLIVAIALIMVVGAFVLGQALKNSLRTSGNCVNTVTSAGVYCPS